MFYQSWTRFIVVLSLGIATPFGVASANAPSILKGWMQAIARDRTKICESLLDDPRVTKTANAVALQALKDSRTHFSNPEDRLLIELSIKPDDPTLSVMTPLGKEEAKIILDRKFSFEDLAAGLIGARPVTEKQATQILISRSDAQIRKMIEARDRKDWSEGIRIFEEEFSKEIQQLEFSQQQLAFMLNRRRHPGDIERAEKILKHLVQLGSHDGETFGLLGRIGKDRYEQAVTNEAPLVERHRLLDEAIDFYNKGFMADPTNYYPGINVIELLVEKGTVEALQQATEVAPTLRFMLKRLGPTAQTDYWVQATSFSLACLERNWAEAKASLTRALATTSAPWMLETTLNNQRGYRRLFKQVLGSESTEHNELINALSNAIHARQTARPHLATDVKIEASRMETLPRAEGIIQTIPINLAAEAAKTGFGVQLPVFQRFSKGVLTVQDLLKSFSDNKQPGYLLGMTKEAHRPIYEGIAAATHLETWWKSYERFGLTGLETNHTSLFMERITSESVPVVFLVPRNLFHSSKLSFTATEMSWLLEHPESRTTNVYFVFGAYEMIPEAFVRDVLQRNGSGAGTDILSAVIRSWQQHLLR